VILGTVLPFLIQDPQEGGMPQLSQRLQSSDRRDGIGRYALEGRRHYEQLCEGLKEHNRYPAPKLWIEDLREPSQRLRTPLGRWLACLRTFQHEQGTSITVEQATFWHDLVDAETALNEYDSSLEEIVLFDLLTPQLVKQAWLDDLQRERRALKEPRKRWKQITSQLRLAKKTFEKMDNDGQLFGQPDDLTVFAEALATACEKSIVLNPPKQWDKNRVQAAMVAHGGVRLWTNPLVWNEVSAVAVLVLRLRDVSARNAYIIVAHALALLFGQVAHVPFTKLSVGRMTRAARQLIRATR